MKHFLHFVIFIFLFITEVKSQQVIYYRDHNSSLGFSYYTDVFVCDTTASGNYLVVGSSGGNNGSSYIYAELDKNGYVVWQKDSAIYGNLGIHDASFSNGRRTLDNGFIFCGGLNDYNLNVYGTFLLKTDSSGNEVWRKFIPHGGAASGIYVAGDSTLYFSGMTSGNFFLLRLSSTGNNIFMNYYPLNAPGAYPENLLCIDNKLFICSTIYTNTHPSGFLFVSTDTSGNYLSEHSFVDSIHNLMPNSFSPTNDYNILVSSTQKDTAFNGAGIVQLMKIDTTATILWQNTLDTIAYPSSHACELTDGNIVATYGENKVQKINSSGITLSAKDLAEPVFHGNYGISESSLFLLNDSTYLISSTKSVQAPGGRWFYLTKISNTALVSVPEIDAYNYSVFPNPVNDFLILNGVYKHVSTFTITDLSGNKLISGVINNVNTSVNVSELNAGVYFLRIGDEQMKFIKF